MIIDPNCNMVSYTDNPPAYEFVAAQGPSADPRASATSDKLPKSQSPAEQGTPMSPITTVYGTSVPMMQQPTVYHYHNPATGEHLTSLLPPTHPEMICLQEGAHVTQTKFGILGILAAIVWFPLGIGLCLLDRQVKCKRCGLTIDSGLCG
ncbi:hypothetical protein F5I97DRAFT_764089 [Phlebopus sp. FC_14]|nr:hypothetical protein F5I97DRAFT_764089 [Phlebopus sp. FC_14]